VKPVKHPEVEALLYKFSQNPEISNLARAAEITVAAVGDQRLATTTPRLYETATDGPNARLSTATEVTGGWRKLHHEKLQNFYSMPIIIRMNKSRKMRWAWHVA
jgi:hypothetical protein